MRKLSKYVDFVLLFLCIIGLFSGCSSDKSKYPSGRDTVESFGDGTYQLMRHMDKTIGLVNLDGQCVLIEDKVYKYKIVDDRIFTYGDIGYSILNYKTNELKQYLTFEGFSKDKLDQYNIVGKKSNEEYYGDKWIKVSKYEDFSPEEKKVLDSLK